MSEAELVQHYWSSVENGLSALALYISVFTGYLLMAYLVGSRLTSVQCTIATGAFLVFTGYNIWGNIAFWNSAYVVAKELKDVRPELLLIDLNPAYIAAALLSIGVIGALKFMWDVRHPKPG
jgi:hypothetical protein